MSFRTALSSLRSAPENGAASALRRPPALVLQALLLLALVAGATAWAATGKTVALAVDGEVREVSLRGDTVADVLEAADLSVGEHDSLVPAAGTAVEDGDRVALRRARPLELTLDGEQRTVWVTALSVDEALQQLDLRGEDLAVSASRSRRIPLSGLTLGVRTPQDLLVAVDGQTLPVASSAPTVAGVLDQAGVVLGELDRVTPALGEAPVAGSTVTVQRVVTETTTAEVPLPFGTERREDDSMTKGTTKQLQAGKNGLVRRTTLVTRVDGAVESRIVTAEERLAEPTPRIVAVGTKPAPAPAPRTSSTSSGPRQSTGGADSLNWPALARCESGGNPRAVSPTGKYRGLYQFSIATWNSVGGSGDPAAASPDEQTYRAKLLYNRSGAGQWPHCGKYLFT
ncbi:MAG TPA: ubiquitin-like domain-containing protein [Mycobacteriales bacterium]|nr:ubiquitin-like domain-containing protein [Mycobacteriales bacterium]